MGEVATSAEVVNESEGLHLWDIVQLAQASKRSLELHIRSAHDWGLLFFDGGRLIHAQTNELQGDDALQVILDWTPHSLALTIPHHHPPHTVKKSSITPLLMQKAELLTMHKAQAPIVGHFDGIPAITSFDLWDIIQLAQILRRSLHLSLQTIDGSGDLYFRQGRLLHAHTEQLVGDEAVNKMLEWHEGSLISAPLPPQFPTSVQRSTIVALLLNSARMYDEQQREAQISQVANARLVESSRGIPVPNQERVMQLEAAKSILEEIDDALSGRILAAHVISNASGLSIASIRPSPEHCHLFSRLAEQLENSLERSDKVPFRKAQTIMIEGDDGTFVFVIEMTGNFRLVLILDKDVHIGMLFSVVLPDSIPKLQTVLKKYTDQSPPAPPRP